MPTAIPRRSVPIPLTKGLLIAVWILFCPGLALSVTYGDTSPKGRGTGVPIKLSQNEEDSIFCARGLQKSGYQSRIITYVS